MVEFLRTSKISSNIEDIIVDAKEHITFVTPYLRFTKTLYERLLEKDDQGVKIRFIYGKVKLHDDQEQLLKRLKNISIFFLENLHAKCYLNEEAGIVTSMNLYDFSEKNNREMGIFFRRTDNENLYTQVNAEVESIMKAAVPQSNNYRQRSYIQETKTQEDKANLSNTKVTSNPYTPTYTRRLFQKLKQEFQYSTFEYILRDDKIICMSFCEFFRLEIEPRGSYYRVNFQLTANDYRIRNKYYDLLYDCRYQIERHFPENVVNWGGTMRRIKFDFPQKIDELENLDEGVYIDWVKKANQILQDILRSALAHSNSTR